MKDDYEYKNDVILVDEDDNAIGTMEKMEAHKKGRLHRAVSVFIFNSNDQMLIQRRAKSKYHSPGLWTNAACTHPYPGEQIKNAASRRLNEEMGVETSLDYGFSFIYRAVMENNLTEHEYDHVFIGQTDDKPKLDPNEVMEYRYIDEKELANELTNNPDSYTAWFKLCHKKAIKKYKEYYREVKKAS